MSSSSSTAQSGNSGSIGGISNGVSSNTLLIVAGIIGFVAVMFFVLRTFRKGKK